MADLVRERTSQYLNVMAQSAFKWVRHRNGSTLRQVTNHGGASASRDPQFQRLDSCPSAYVGKDWFNAREGNSLRGRLTGCERH